MQGNYDGDSAQKKHVLRLMLEQSIKMMFKF